MPERPLIKIRDLWHIYPDGVVALRNVNLDVKKGELIAIVGQNGAGKTTLAKHLNGLLRPTKGSVIVGGIDSSNASTSLLSKIVGYVFQNPDHQLFAESVEEEVAFGPRNLGLPDDKVKRNVDETLRILGIEHLRERYPLALSFGERHMIAIASILSMRPEVIVFDELTTGLDFKGIRKIMKVIWRLNAKGHTILVITHDMTLVAECSERVIVMSSGEVLLDGPAKEVFDHPEALKKASLRPPQIAQLARMLTEYDFPSDIFRVDDFCQAVLEKVMN